MSKQTAIPRRARARYRKLVDVVNHHRHLYHVLDAPEISDEAYDSLFAELLALEERYPALRFLGSPTGRVGDVPLPAFEKVRHAVRQWSFDNVFTENELRKWEERIRRYLERETNVQVDRLKYVCEHKIDGLKIVLTYRDGVFIEGATRGDGVTGENITQNLKTINSIPLTLRKKINLVVGGEAWLSENEFERINRERGREGSALFANPRNAAAGSLRQLDPKIAASRRLDSFVYDIEIITGAAFSVPKTQIEELELLSGLGFKVNQHFAPARSLDEVIAYYHLWYKKREREPFEMDGIVVKVNDLRIQETLGYTGKAPRFAVAFKYPAEQTTTVLEGIGFQVGRTGVVTPVAQLRPVRVAGSTVSRATLHNEDQIRRLDVRIGDTVIVQKAGDVIPEVVSVVKDVRTGREKPFHFPKRVEGCGGDGSIERVLGQAAYRCVHRGSFEERRRRFHHFVSKKALNIEGLGPNIVDLLLERGLVSAYDDLFTLTEGDLMGLPSFKEKSAHKLVSAIKQSRKTSLPRFLTGLSIDHVGEETAHDLAQQFGSLEKIKSASLEELDTLEGIGEVVARSVRGWFSDSQNKALLKRLTKLIEIYRSPPAQQALAGRTFVVTGTLKDFTRDEAKEAIRARGGTVSSSVSKNIDYVVVGENPGSKYERALKLDIHVLDEVSFKKILGLR